MSGGLLKGNVNVSGYATPDITIASNTFSSTPDTTPSIETDLGLSLGGQLGLTESIDFYLSAGIDTAGTYGLQWQFMGDSVSSAKSGNISLAVAAGLAIGSSTENGVLIDETNEVKVDYLGWELRFMGGYRPSESVLLHGSLFTTSIDVDNEIFLTQSGATTQTADTKSDGQQIGIGIGVRFDLWDRLFSDIRGWYSSTRWKRTEPSEIKLDNQNEFFAGANFGFKW